MTRNCANCGSRSCRVVDTRLQSFPPLTGEIVRRRRRCMQCRECWWTVELPEDLVNALILDNDMEEVPVSSIKTFSFTEYDDEVGES